MPSQPPLLHLPPPLPTRPASQPLPEPAFRPLVNVPAVIAASAVGLALVVGVLAWIVTHPVKASQPPESATTPAIPAAAPEVTMETPTPSPVATPTFAPAAVTPVSHVNRQDVVLNRLPLIEEAPPLPPPPRREPEAEAAAPANGETYGTNVLFMNNPAAAAESARRDNKLLFVMHISGNFEDSCFT